MIGRSDSEGLKLLLVESLVRAEEADVQMGEKHGHLALKLSDECAISKCPREGRKSKLLLWGAAD